MEITVMETPLTDEVLDILLRMSADWAAENSCRGYYPNSRADVDGNRIFLAMDGETALGYLFGHESRAERTSSVISEGTPYFEIEELYVVPSSRRRGIGRRLFEAAEAAAKADGLPFLMLGTATKDYHRILHFYIEELGMDFWSARLYKKL